MKITTFKAVATEVEIEVNERGYYAFKAKGGTPSFAAVRGERTLKVIVSGDVNGTNCIDVGLTSSIFSVWEIDREITEKEFLLEAQKMGDIIELFLGDA